MPNSQISDLTEITSPATDDYIEILDVSDTTMSAEGTNKKIATDNLITDDLISDASATVKGKVELATNAETLTGTDTSRAVTPDGLQDKINFANINAHRGFLVNGKISPTVASDNLTVAIKGLDGNDPSATNPVYCRIGDTVRSITAALSVTKNAGTNWCDSGGTELATKEVDYFVYLGYNATDGVVIGFSRIPHASEYDSFSTTTTDEEYCAISTISNAAAGDDYELIGRFAATLSAGAGYTWTVPTYTNKNLVQRPVYETRLLDWTTVRAVSSGTAPTYTNKDVNKYRIRGKRLEWEIYADNASGGTAGNGANRITQTLPFDCSLYTTPARTIVGYGHSYEEGGNIDNVICFQESTNGFSMWDYAGTGISGNDQSSTVRFMDLRGDYEI